MEAEAAAGSEVPPAGEGASGAEGAVEADFAHRRVQGLCLQDDQHPAIRRPELLCVQALVLAEHLAASQEAHVVIQLSHGHHREQCLI